MSRALWRYGKDEINEQSGAVTKTPPFEPSFL